MAPPRGDSEMAFAIIDFRMSGGNDAPVPPSKSSSCSGARMMVPKLYSPLSISRRKGFPFEVRVLAYGLIPFGTKKGVLWGAQDLAGTLLFAPMFRSGRLFGPADLLHAGMALILPYVLIFFAFS